MTASAAALCPASGTASSPMGMPVPTPAPDAAPAADEDFARIVQQGYQALRSGDFPAALELFARVVAAHPQRPEGHNNLGALYSALGETAKAEVCFDKVLALLPGNPNVLYNRGLVRARQQRITPAREDFAAVLAHDPDDPETHNNLGVLDFGLGALAAARGHFQAALRVRPDYPAAVLNLCDLECQQGDPRQGAQVCRDYLAGHCDPGVRRRLLDLQLQECRDGVDQACRNAEDLLQEAGDDVASRQDLGRLIRARAALTDAHA